MNKTQNLTVSSRHSVFSRLFNVTPNEWPRIIISWLLLFFYRMGYVIGWTILITMVITKFGILSLPYFFIINAGFRIIGAFIYANFINRFKKDNIILFTLLGGILFLFTALIVSNLSDVLFILFTLFSLSVFFTQIYIIGSAFIEDLFTPLESERTFPIIESAETIGGIIGGLAIALFASNMPMSNFVYLLIVCLTFIGPIVLFYRGLLKKMPFMHFKRKKKSLNFSFKSIKDSFTHMKNIPFLKVLLIIVLAQWIFIHLLEFQYTSAVFQNLEPDITNQEQMLAHGLGTLYVLIHLFALVMQLLIASRIISSLGIMSSLLLHPIVTLLGLGTMLFSFGFSSAVVTKLNFEITNIIHKNAYHSSYYAIQPNIREQVREFLEGFAQPVGALIGMIVLIILQNVFGGVAFNSAITIFMMAIFLFMSFIIIKNESKYTHTSVKHLLKSDNTLLQLNAIEILGQKGHRGATRILTKTLKQDNLEDIAKIRILNTLAHIKDTDSIIEVLDCMRDESYEVRLAALHSLNRFLDIRRSDSEYPFSNHRINTELMQIFEEETDNRLKSLIIKILVRLQNHKIVPFLIRTIQNAGDYLKTDCIELCSQFNDINLAHYLLPFLKSEEPKVVASTIVALWQFKKYRSRLIKRLKELMYDDKHDNIIESYYVFGEIKAIQEKNRLIESLKDDDECIRLAASMALAKMNIFDGFDNIVEAVLSFDADKRKNLVTELEKFPPKVYDKINDMIRSKVSMQINQLLEYSNKTSLEELDKDTLVELRNAYELVNDHEEVQNIKGIITKVEIKDKSLQFNPS